jgi:hypothetical protein
MAKEVLAKVDICNIIKFSVFSIHPVDTRNSHFNIFDIATFNSLRNEFFNNKQARVIEGLIHEKEF